MENQQKINNREYLRQKSDAHITEMIENFHWFISLEHHKYDLDLWASAMSLIGQGKAELWLRKHYGENKNANK